MAELFAFKIRAEPAGQVVHRTLKADFGDGYSQAAGDGINTRSESWNIEARGPWLMPGCTAGQAVKDIAEFLDERAGWQAFEWTPPDGELGLYRCDGYTKQRNGGGIVTLSATFYQVFA